MEPTYEKFATKLQGKGIFDPAMIIAILMQILPLLCPAPTPATIIEQAKTPGFRLRSRLYSAMLNAGMTARQASAAFSGSMAVLAESTEEEVAGYLAAANE